MDIPSITSRRLDLVSMSPAFIRASLEGDRARAATLLGAELPPDWPGESAARTLRRRMHQLDADPTEQAWLLRAMLTRKPLSGGAAPPAAATFTRKPLSGDFVPPAATTFTREPPSADAAPPAATFTREPLSGDAAPPAAATFTREPLSADFVPPAAATFTREPLSADFVPPAAATFTREPLSADFVPPVAATLMRGTPHLTLVGRIGFHAPPDARGALEIGYAVEPAHRRRGYATEAVEAMLAWAQREHAIRHFVASVSPANVPSLAVVRRFGFVQTGAQWDDEDGEELVFELHL